MDSGAEIVSTLANEERGTFPPVLEAGVPDPEERGTLEGALLAAADGAVGAPVELTAAGTPIVEGRR